MPSSFTPLCLPSDSPGCRGASPSRFTPGVTLSRTCPSRRFPPRRPLPSGFARAQKQGGDLERPLPLLEKGFCNLLSCCWARNQKVEEAGTAESGSLSLFYCETHLGLWGFQYKEASGPASPRDEGWDAPPCSPKPPLSLGQGGHKALKDPAPSTAGARREINPPNF